MRKLLLLLLLFVASCTMTQTSRSNISVRDYFAPRDSGVQTA
ncbi:MAG TPA: hypothetical protein VH396_22405 [Chitinophagaceae bacterium]